MATNFTSVGVKNALTVSGTATLATLIATAVTLTTVGITTANITTANVTTGNIQTHSGSEVRARNRIISSGSLVVEGTTALESTTTATTVNAQTVNATTLSGWTLRTNLQLATSGSLVVEGATTMVGVLTAQNTISGALLRVTQPGAGTGKVVINGSLGAEVCYRDTDNAGWTACTYLNGVETCATANAATCP